MTPARHTTRRLHRPLVAIAVLAASSIAAASTGCKSNSIASTTDDGVVIGPQGGVVTGEDGAEVRIPPGALTADTKISITVASPSQYPTLPSSTMFVSKVYSFEPHGQRFNSPVVIDLPFTPGAANLTALHADPNGAWTSVQPTMFLTTNTAEFSATSFSFYAVGSTTQAEAGGPSCSGRGPDMGAPSGSVSMGMGTYDAQQFLEPKSDFALLVDGYATAATGPHGGQPCVGDAGTVYTLNITLTPYMRACGYFRNGVAKIGMMVPTLQLWSTTPIAARTYRSPDEVALATPYIPTNKSAGSCGGYTQGSGGPSFTCTGGTPAVTITAIDATHVAGTFSLDSGQGTVSGTFDVPFCQQNAGLDPAYCCIQ